MKPPRLDGSIVVDANVLFSALLRDGATRHLLLHAGLDLHTPGHIWEEFARNRAFLLTKSHATEAAFDLLLDSLRYRVADVPLALVAAHLETALDRLGKRDALDAPYVAAALALKATLWTQDKRLRDKAPVPVVTTEELVTARRSR